MATEAAPHGRWRSPTELEAGAGSHVAPYLLASTKACAQPESRSKPPKLHTVDQIRQESTRKPPSGVLIGAAAARGGRRLALLNFQLQLPQPLRLLNLIRRDLKQRLARLLAAAAAAAAAVGAAAAAGAGASAAAALWGCGGRLGRMSSRRCSGLHVGSGHGGSSGLRGSGSGGSSRLSGGSGRRRNRCCWGGRGGRGWRSCSGSGGALPSLQQPLEHGGVSCRIRLPLLLHLHQSPIKSRLLCSRRLLTRLLALPGLQVGMEYNDSGGSQLEAARPCKPDMAE